MKIAHISIVDHQLSVKRLDYSSAFMRHLIYPLTGFTKMTYYHDFAELFEDYRVTYALGRGAYAMFCQEMSQCELAYGEYDLIYEDNVMFIPGIKDRQIFLFLYGAALSGMLPFEIVSDILAGAFAMFLASTQLERKDDQDALYA